MKIAVGVGQLVAEREGVFKRHHAGKCRGAGDAGQYGTDRC